ncbi:MAG: UDP-3-O-(3-hydroxymyristoyl)glucosamine N-acyltransferase [Bacteroidota bacterium]
MGQEVHIGAFCFIGAGVVIGDGCIIHPQVYIGNQVSVGNETVIYPQVRIYHQCQVGAHCIIHGGTTIGSDGFGFAPNAEGQYVKVRQTGNVIVEDHVEIGSNCCLDRATLGSTVIKKGAKLDNLVQIAHNVVIGENSVLAAQAGIAGSTQLGKSVMVGGQAGFIGHLHIADYTMIDAQSGVNKSIKKPGQAFRGSPIQSYRQQLKSEVFFRKLEAMQRKIDELEKALKAKD